MSIIIIPTLTQAFISIFLEVLEIPPVSTVLAFTNNNSRRETAATRQYNRSVGAGAGAAAVSSLSADASLILQELVAYSEVVCRTALVHELRITPFSLGAAVARGLTPDAVYASLRRHARTGQGSNIDWPRIAAFVQRCMLSFSRARLVVRGGGDVMVECADEEAYETLTNDDMVKSMMADGQEKYLERYYNNNFGRVDGGKQHVRGDNDDADRIPNFLLDGDESSANNALGMESSANLLAPLQQLTQAQQQTDARDDFEEIPLPRTTTNLNSRTAKQYGPQQQPRQPAAPNRILAFCLKDIQCANHVVSRSFVLGMPLRRHYDFINDVSLRRTNIGLRSTAQPRPYQRAAVESAVGAGTGCSSGVIVIPCGGGKTLIGVMLVAAVRRPTVILCVNALSVEQWKEQLDRFACVSSSTGGLPGDDTGNSTANGRSKKKSGAASSTAATAGSTIRTAMWTAKKKDPITPETDVVITTYHALGGLVRRRNLAATAAGAAGKEHQPKHRRRSNNNTTTFGDDDDDDDEDEGGDATAVRRTTNNTKNGKSSNASATNSALSEQPLLDWSWGLLLLDEAHVVPASYFRDGVTAISSKACIGLTATFVREDDKISDLQHICGPKLFDIGWEALRDAGYLASVRCHEVMVPMPPIFQGEYWNRCSAFSQHQEETARQLKEEQQLLRLKRQKKQQQQQEKKKTTSRAVLDDDDNDDEKDFLASSSSDDADAVDVADKSTKTVIVEKARVKNLHPVLIALAASNPSKILCAKAIVERHRGQKILVFCDIISLLLEYAAQLRCPAIHGGVPHSERVRLFSDFENSATRNVLCVSRVGEIAINLPSARVVIQVSSHGGSRRQEAQRLGRVLRPKLGVVNAAAAADNDDDDGASANSGLSSKRHVDHVNTSYFYSLVSADTLEVDYAARRIKFLIDQGYQADQEFWQPEPYVAPSTTVAADGDAARTKNKSDLAVSEDEATVKREAAAAVKQEFVAIDVTNTSHFSNSTTTTAMTKRAPPKKASTLNLLSGGGLLLPHQLNNNSGHNNSIKVDIRSPEWTVAWLAKVIARWELDNAAPLKQKTATVGAGTAQRRARVEQDEAEMREAQAASAAMFAQEKTAGENPAALVQQVRQTISAWTTGGGDMVYDEAS